MVSAQHTIGVLALQGDFAEHLKLLETMHVTAKAVRSLEGLANISGLIIPGGESTVMSVLLIQEMREEIQRRRGNGSLPIYGTCAGVILLAQEITGKNPPPSLALMDITVERNAYGTQLQSFQDHIRLKGESKGFLVTFIRAPKITRVGKHVEVLASHESHPVLVREGSLLAGTFHPELTSEPRIHRIFLQLLK